MQSSYLHAFFDPIAKQDAKFTCQQAEDLELEKAGVECKKGDSANLMSKCMLKSLQRKHESVGAHAKSCRVNDGTFKYFCATLQLKG